MSISKTVFAQYIKEFKLKELFNELGWDNVKVNYPVSVDNKLYSLIGLAQKKEFLVLLCEPLDGGYIPDSADRKKIDNKITKLHYEHLIVYVDGKKTRQHWELVVREQNKPIVCRPIDYYTGQAPELLFQKLEGLFFAYEDEEKLSIVDVRSRVMANFEKNAEVVTKKFYEKFSKEHKSFLKFIEGIESIVDREWYASLMLNRLMFIYFIQKKGFLDENKDYLRSKLSLIQQRKGKNKFYSFYRDFLLVLFHKGLGSPLHDKKFEEDFGRIPYLNGGLFDVHQLEHDNPKIQIEDKAFERIFDFFDEYNWHLDTRITSTGKDINPDVIGYIFEKYINDRAAMGAYYTKEDITEYISKNCIVPWLFDEIKRNYPKPFTKDSEVWSLLKGSNDNYIYPAIKYGIILNSSEENGFADLPKDIQEGLDPNMSDLVEKRKCWNKPAPDNIALPTEIYREVIARRKRYYEIKKKIEQGEITEINDFITYNLNIRQFVQDIIQRTDDAKLVMEFYKAVRKVTVLDPTCGSGAFLFAALNVLEPLYFACVTRMQEFVTEDGTSKHKFFEDQLEIINAPEHPSTEYFIYKSIILHNLYGVDIMKEAVEISKLRLFLKLVATVDVDYKKPNLGLEPLPDIDFNIRSGNTLVGYATLTDLDKSAQGGLFGSKEKDAILEQADIVSRAYERFKDSQLVMHTDPKSYKYAKDELIKRLDVLNERLNKHLAVTYLGENHSEKAYEAWLFSHQPFHWLAEYYTTIAQGGFDVIIGNPPYVEYSEIDYEIKNYMTSSCGNLYPFVTERSINLLQTKGRFGMILPISSICTDRMKPHIKILAAHKSWNSLYAERPSKLFVGPEVQLVISILDISSYSCTYSTKYHKWESIFRPYLFQDIAYIDPKDFVHDGSIPKVGTMKEIETLKKLKMQSASISKYRTNNSKYFVTYRNAGGRYFKIALNFEPIFKINGIKQRSSTYQFILCDNSQIRDTICAIMNSNLFFWYWLIYSDTWHMIGREIYSFPIVFDEQLMKSLCTQTERLMDDYLINAVARKEKRNKGKDIVEFKQFNARESKVIIDEIDKVLAKHYGFTEEELDFIINYDIKYRMGKELEGEE